jgi:hypothetical protein
MDRRAFLQRLSIAASALAVDPERWLWTPGKKTVFIPKIEAPAASSLWLVQWMIGDSVRVIGHTDVPPDGPLPENTVVVEELRWLSLASWAKQQDRRVFRFPLPEG